MITANKGYRTESYSGSRIRKLENVIYFELGMGNSDILTFIQQNIQDIDFPLDLDAEEASFLILENRSYYEEKIQEVIQNQLPGENYTALWLTSKDNAVHRYNDGSVEGIEEYVLPNEFVVISDLGEDGALFVWKE